jgi:hypothetical protein
LEGPLRPQLVVASLSSLEISFVFRPLPVLWQLQKRGKRSEDWSN